MCFLWERLCLRSVSYLLSALDDIKGTHDHVSETARQDTTNHTLAIIAHIVNVTSAHFERFA